MSDFENSYNYVCECPSVSMEVEEASRGSSSFPPLTLSVSRLAGMDQTIHKLTVGHYTLDVKVSQLIQRLTTLEGTSLVSISPSFLSRPHNSASSQSVDCDHVVPSVGSFWPEASVQPR